MRSSSKARPSGLAREDAIRLSPSVRHYVQDGNGVVWGLSVGRGGVLEVWQPSGRAVAVTMPVSNVVDLAEADEK